MKTIKCEVVKDLLPLYVDNVLSKESRELVEEHFAICAECKDYYEKLKDVGDEPINKATDDGKKVIQNIRRSISRKRVGAICLTAILVAAIAVGLFYCIMIKQQYLTYEECGLYVEKEAIYTNEPYYCYYAFESIEKDTLFVYMTTTVYESHRNRNGEVMVDDLFCKYTVGNGENEEVIQNKIKRIYYVSEKYIKKLRDGYFQGGTKEENIAINQERLEKIKKDSSLIWEE